MLSECLVRSVVGLMWESVDLRGLLLTEVGELIGEPVDLRDTVCFHAAEEDVGKNPKK